jgi:hypothetical protein
MLDCCIIGVWAESGAATGGDVVPSGEREFTAGL